MTRPSVYLFALRSCVRRFSEESGASAAVEFALLAIPLLGLVCAVIETAFVLLLSISLENTTQQMARLIKTGQAQQAGIQDAQSFRTKLLCPAIGNRAIPFYMSCGSILLDVRTSTALNKADMSNDFYRNTNSRFCLGGPQSIVILRVAYVFPSLLPILYIFANGSVGANRTGLVNDAPGFVGWNHLIFNAAAFQNENYTGSAAC